MTDFLDKKHQEITNRLKELEPVVDEFKRLEAAAEALVGVIGSAASEATSVAVATVTRRRGRGRRRGSGTRKKAAKATAAAAAPEAVAPTVERKKPGRPKGSGKKVGRPPGSGKKVGRPKGRREKRRTAQRQRQTCDRSGVARSGSAGHHDPRAGGEDGDQAELLVSRAPRPRAGRQAGEERSRLVSERLLTTTCRCLGTRGGRLCGNNTTRPKRGFLSPVMMI